MCVYAHPSIRPFSPICLKITHVLLIKRTYNNDKFSVRVVFYKRQGWCGSGACGDVATWSWQSFQFGKYSAFTYFSGLNFRVIFPLFRFAVVLFINYFSTTTINMPSSFFNSSFLLPSAMAFGKSIVCSFTPFHYLLM